MKILLICNIDKKEFLQSEIKKQWKLFTYTVKDLANLDSRTESKKLDLSTATNTKEFNNLEFEANSPAFVFIYSGLKWSEDKIDFNKSYEFANIMITEKLKGKFFQLVFISAFDRNELYTYTANMYHRFIESFSHFAISNIENIGLFSTQYSSIHFELIKSLVVSQEGRLIVLEHQLSSIKHNFEKLSDNADLTEVKNKLQKQLAELSISQVWASRDPKDLMNEIKKSNKKSTIRKCINSIQELIDEIKIKQKTKNEVNAKNKSNYKVLIIEDELEYRNFFCETFSNLYNYVYPSTKKELIEFEIAKAKEIIEQRAKDYNIIVLDLLYKDKLDCWLPFNGLDLYRIAKEKNPYASIRIITSLPRDIVAKIVELYLKVKVPVSHVFTKKVGFDSLKHIIYDRVLEINIECMEQEKKKSLFKPIPTEGIFKWPTVTEMILNSITDVKGKYSESLVQAFDFYDKFKQGQLEINTLKWNKGKLPSPKKKDSISESFLFQKLPSILTHRLLVIEYALKHKRFLIETEYYIDVVLEKISNISSLDTGYLNTKLGFNVVAYSKQDIIGFIIELRNLFPHEIAFVADKLATVHKNDRLDAHKELYIWFVNILVQNDTYQNWQALNLSFNPYNETSVEDKYDISPSDISLELKFVHLMQFLQSLIDNFTNRNAEKILQITRDNFNINEKNVNLPVEIKFVINQMMDI